MQNFAKHFRHAFSAVLMASVLAILLTFTSALSAAQASDVLPFGLQGELSLTTLNFSKHFQALESDTDQVYNERHSGVGLEYAFNDETAAGYIEFDNSYSLPSEAVYGVHKNWLAGLANGYPEQDPLGEYRPLVGYVWDYGQVRGLLTPAFVAVGLRIPFS